MIKSILIANRGEIACRIIHTAKQLGIHTVAVYSAADSHAMHVQLADEAVYLGNTLQETYLNAEKIVAIALELAVDAIHPGYGFLSENFRFAELCQQAGVIFIGPSAKVIKLMGLKDEAKKVVEKLGIPLLPGYHGDKQDEKTLLAEAKKIGFPVLLKAAAGGGGKGMRIVNDANAFSEQLAAAKREALASFSNDTMLIEKYLTQPRHIEVQIAADSHGNVVHLFERDCSIQRRYQKVIEEAPAPNISPELCQRLHAAAVAIAKNIAYQGVGTIECLVEGDEFYFMEMNTRLQVEHPVTELITHQDLVAWQIRIAQGEPLPLKQNEIVSHGHAVEVRLCAEDPEKNYLPSAGRIEYVRWPSHVRIETGVQQGDIVSVLYDSMLAKIIAWGDTRENAIQQLAYAVDQLEWVGVSTNQMLLKNILASPDYRSAKLSTHFIASHQAALLEKFNAPWHIILSLASAYLIEKEYASCDKNPWSTLLGFRIDSDEQWIFYFSKPHMKIVIRKALMASSYQLDCEALAVSTSFRQLMYHQNTHHISAEIAGRVEQAGIVELGQSLHLFYDGGHIILQNAPDYSMGEQTSDFSSIRSPIPGNIVAILVKPGDKVKKGQSLVVMEAMKMEHTLVSPSDCVVQKINFDVKQQIEEGVEIIRFERENEATPRS